MFKLMKYSMYGFICCLDRWTHSELMFVNLICVIIITLQHFGQCQCCLKFYISLIMQALEINTYNWAAPNLIQSRFLVKYISVTCQAPTCWHSMRMNSDEFLKLWRLCDLLMTLWFNSLIKIWRLSCHWLRFKMPQRADKQNDFQIDELLVVIWEQRLWNIMLYC